MVRTDAWWARRDSGVFSVEEATGLQPPRLDSGLWVTGATKEALRKQNKQKRVERQVAQPRVTYWTTHTGTAGVRPGPNRRPKHEGAMCPAGLALRHPAAPVLMDYAKNGCPMRPGRDWTAEEITAAVEQGSHKSALEEDTVAQLHEEVTEKVQSKQARLCPWSDV